MADEGSARRRLPILGEELEEMREQLGRLELEVETLARELPSAPTTHAEMLEMFRKFRAFGPPTRVFSYGEYRALEVLPWLAAEDTTSDSERPPKPSLPASPLKLQVNLVPGGTRRAPVEVRIRKHSGHLSKEAQAELKALVGEDAWPTFVQRWRDVYYGLNQAAREVDGIRDAITADDLARWSSKAAKQLEAIELQIANLTPQLERVSAPLLAALRAQHAMLGSYLALLTRTNPFDADRMFVTGEYER